MKIRYKKPYRKKGIHWASERAYQRAHEELWLPMVTECFGGYWRCTHGEW
jgi:hypothetical protein